MYEDHTAEFDSPMTLIKNGVMGRPGGNEWYNIIVKECDGFSRRLQVASLFQGCWHGTSQPSPPVLQYLRDDGAGRRAILIILRVPIGVDNGGLPIHPRARGQRKPE